jgi:methylenetetrahydrofolate dehydrogenase (NADP+)/methenyltetrahydrofolate cyclohydrolase
LTRLLKGKDTALAVRREVASAVGEMVARNERPPGLVAVLIGDDPGSKLYVGNKTKACREAGIRERTIELDETVAQQTVLDTIDELNADPAIDGILLQLPVPGQLTLRQLRERIDPAKDVDVLHPENVGRLWLGEPRFVPCTPAGIVELLAREEIELAGRRAVIVGRSDIVGKPMAGLLLARHCTVTVCHSRTRDLPEVCRQADLLVAAVGRAGFLGAESVKQGAVVVDVGINRISDAAEVERLFPGDENRRRTLERRGSVVVGDVDFTAVAPRVAAITPVPGGVGPLTVAMLLRNTLDARRERSVKGA